MQIRLPYKRRGHVRVHSRWEGLSFHRRMSAIHPGSINHRLRHHATDTSMHQASPSVTSLRHHRAKVEPTHAAVSPSSRFVSVEPTSLFTSGTPVLTFFVVNVQASGNKLAFAVHISDVTTNVVDSLWQVYPKKCSRRSDEKVHNAMLKLNTHVRHLLKGSVSACLDQESLHP